MPYKLKWKKKTHNSTNVVLPATAKKPNLLQTVLVQFYTAIIDFILIFSIIVRFCAQAKNKPQLINCSFEKIIGCSLLSTRDLLES